MASFNTIFELSVQEILSNYRLESKRQRKNSSGEISSWNGAGQDPFSSCRNRPEGGRSRLILVQSTTSIKIHASLSRQGGVDLKTDEILELLRVESECHEHEDPY